MNKTKLLVDAHVFDDIFQGTRTFLKGIYRNLETDNLEIYLAASNIENLKKEFSGVPNLKFLKLKSKNKFVRLGYEIPALIKKHNIDFAHFNYYLPLFLSRKCKYVVTIHDILFLDFPYFFPKLYYWKNNLLFRLGAKRADIVSTVSKYSAERISEKFRIKENEILILPNAIDEKFLELQKKTDDREYIQGKYGISSFLLFVSRIEPRKNHSALLATYDKLELWKQDIDIVFIGKKAIADPLFELHLEKVQARSNQRVHLLENVNSADLLKFYNSAKIAIFPAICEGFGIPPLESAAMKTPTICSNLTAMREFKFFGDYHIDPRDQNQLSLSIEQMQKEISSGTILSKMEEIAKIVKTDFQWKHTAQKLVEKIELENKKN